MAKRSVREIPQDIKECISKLLDATKRSELAEHDMVVSIAELVKLEKELEDLDHSYVKVWTYPYGQCQVRRGFLPEIHERPI